jgi:outer membrane protein W
MRKKIIMGLGVLALLVFLGGVTLAQEPSAKRFGLGARLSYYEVDDVQVNSQLGTEVYRPDATGLFEGNFTFFLHRLFSFEIAAGYAKTDIDADVNFPGLLIASGDYGEFEQIPILGTARVHLWHPDPSRPSGFYIGLGLGYYINDLTLSSAVKNFLPTFNVDVDNSFGAHANAGFEINLVDNLALNLDLKYVFMNEADVTLSLLGVGSTTTEIDLEGLIFGVGLKYYF